MTVTGHMTNSRTTALLVLILRSSSLNLNSFYGQLIRRSYRVRLQKFSMTIVLVGGLLGVLEKPVHSETLTVAAAHSMKVPFQEILPLFEQEYGAMVNVVYGPSQTLRQQIEKGAQIDVFLPEAV